MRHRSPQYAALQRLLQQCSRRVAAGTRAFAFWTSVSLPLGYLLFAVAPSGPPALLVPLIAVHACALALGHTHVPGRGERPATGGA